jgi:hypothetical protein
VRHDDRLREADARRERFGAAEELVDLLRERARVAGIEHAGDGCRSYCGHAAIILARGRL